MNFKPLHDKILIERQEQEQKTSGGIILPDSAQEKPAQGLVIAVGTGVQLDNGDTKPLTLKVGDVVLFAKWGGTEIKLEGKEYLIMQEKDILGIIQ